LDRSPRCRRSRQGLAPVPLTKETPTAQLAQRAAQECAAPTLPVAQTHHSTWRTPAEQGWMGGARPGMPPSRRSASRRIASRARCIWSRHLHLSANPGRCLREGRPPPGPLRGRVQGTHENMSPPRTAVRVSPRPPSDSRFPNPGRSCAQQL
jgi:hypothetical protein